MLQELQKYINKNKKTKSSVIEDFVENNNFFKLSRDKKLSLINSIRSNCVPRMDDRCEITLNLFYHCQEKKDFNFYNNLNYICEIISTGDELKLTANEREHNSEYAYYSFSKTCIKAFTIRQLKKYNEKLYKKIMKDSLGIKETTKIVLGLRHLHGLAYGAANNLFIHTEKIKFNGLILHYALVQKGDQIDYNTYRELRYFNSGYVNSISKKT